MLSGTDSSDVKKSKTEETLPAGSFWSKRRRLAGGEEELEVAGQYLIC